jgi:hypothetical protein
MPAAASNSKAAQAESLFSRTVEIAGHKLGQENRFTLIFLSDFASMYQRQGKRERYE